jgi:hypothetical protein
MLPLVRRTLSLITVIHLLQLVAPVACAWNSTGHMTIALIAYRRLSDAERQQLAEILKSHPHYDSFLLQDKPEDVSAGEWAFLRASWWPDYVRPDRTNAKPESITKYHNGPWHYVDFPFIQPHDKTEFDLAKLQPPKPNLLTVLPDCVAKLGRSDTAPEDRAINLCWVLHLVGDMHQPLHCVSRYSSEFKQGDMGGNALAIRPGAKPMNLHWYWDDVLGTSTAYLAIDQLATTICAAPVHDPHAMRELAEHRTIESWVQEGFEKAKAIVYLNGELKGANWKGWDTGQVTIDAVPPLPVGYEGNARELACRQAALAGLRLTEVLENALKPLAVPKPSELSR